MIKLLFICHGRIYDGNGQLKSAYGDYKYSYQELWRLAK